jgi:hypothetical protein
MPWRPIAVLRDAAYFVIEPPLEEAIAPRVSSMSIDILFTDINLPGKANGLDVGDNFQKYRPDVPVVYTSGWVVDPRRRVHVVCSFPTRINLMTF